MKFIGRQSELAKLNEEYARDNGFVIIYGGQIHIRVHSAHAA